MSGKRIVVLISGSGSNLQAIIDRVNAGAIAGEIAAVISNRASAYGLTRAADAGIETRVLDHKAFADRLAFDQALMETIDSYAADLVVLAGFMRILTPEFVRHYNGRLFNIHPSLLPKFKGLHTHQRALDEGEREHGCTVHFVTEELDGGPAIIQAATAIVAGDNADALQQRVHQLEHRIYPLAVEWFCAGRLQLEAQGVTLDGDLLPGSGYRLQE